MKKTIRLFANPNFTEANDELIKNILSDRFNVLPSCKIYGDTYDLYEECDNKPTNFALFIMHEYLTDREPMMNWFNRMIHPVIDCANFTYIILYKNTDNDYSEAEKFNNIKINYSVGYTNKVSEDMIKILKEISDK